MFTVGLLDVLVVLHGTVELVQGTAVFLEGAVAGILDTAESIVDVLEGAVLVAAGRGVVRLVLVGGLLLAVLRLGLGIGNAFAGDADVLGFLSVDADLAQGLGNGRGVTHAVLV